MSGPLGGDLIESLRRHSLEPHADAPSSGGNPEGHPSQDVELQAPVPSFESRGEALRRVHEAWRLADGPARRRRCRRDLVHLVLQEVDRRLGDVEAALEGATEGEAAGKAVLGGAGAGPGLTGLVAFLDKRDARWEHR